MVVLLIYKMVIEGGCRQDMVENGAEGWQRLGDRYAGAKPDEIPVVTEIVVEQINGRSCAFIGIFDDHVLHDPDNMIGSVSPLHRRSDRMTEPHIGDRCLIQNDPQAIRGK